VRLAEKEVVGSAGRDKVLSRLPGATAGAAINFSHPADARSTNRIYRIQWCARFQIAKAIILLLKMLTKSALLKKNREQIGIFFPLKKVHKN
jgi:hypothetical protein